MEIWKPISSLEGYEASSLGRIRSPSGAILSQNKDHWGYYRVTAKTGRQRLRMRVHALVSEAFNGPKEGGLECRHLNGDKTDNRAENLAWGTSVENKADMARHGTLLKGETHPRAKLTEDVVKLIRSSGVQTCILADAFGVARQTVRKIRAGASWAHV